MAKFPGFVGGSNASQSLVADAERTVNLFVESTQSKAAKTSSILAPTPGFQAWSTTVADVGSRGLNGGSGRLFGVMGGSFYEWSMTGVPTKWGSVLQDSNPAQLVYNGKVGGQLGIVSGGAVYAFDLTTNSFTGPNFGGATATMLAYADGYGLLFDANTGRVYLSALNDLTSFNLGTFFQRSKFPDPWQTMFVDPNGLIWMIGLETFEVWYDTGTGTQPWAPLSGLYGRYGIAAPFAFGVSAAGMFWLARSGSEGGADIVTTHGSVPQVVSTYAVSTAMANYRRTTKISDAELLIYKDQGHTAANFSFPSAGRTWSYDAEGKGWAERGQWNSAAGDYGLWAPRTHADCFGKHIVGDRTTGTLWIMDTALSTEIDGTGIRRLRRTAGVTDEHKRTPIDQIELIMDVGVAGQGLDPQVTLRVSADSRTFGNERRASVGRVGEFGKRVYWNGLGAPPEIGIECVWSDLSPTRVIDCLVNNLEKGA